MINGRPFSSKFKEMQIWRQVVEGRNGRNEVTQRILAAVVMYKMAKKLTVVMWYDVDRTSHAQNMAMQIDKNSALEGFGEHQASLSRKCLLRKNALGPTIATFLTHMDHWEVMSLPAFNDYNAILATISFQIASGLGQCKRHSDAWLCVQGNVIKDSDPSGATGRKICFRIQHLVQNIRSSVYAPDT